MTNPQSFNRYAYAGNDPINFVDPTGLDPDCTDEFNNTGTCTITAGGSNATPPPGFYSDTGIVVVDPPSDGEISGGGPQEPAKPSHDKYSGQGPQTACHIMADVAQNEANTAIYQNSNNFNAALTQFDRTLSTLYVGGPMVSLAEAKRLSRGDLRTINPSEPFTGGSGFRDEYKDSGSEPHPIGGPNADQTHHFAAFLSLGINRQSAIYGYRHYVQGDNQGDLNLGQAAFRLGTQLRRRGTMSTLTQIGDIIRRSFCTDPGHGLYLN
jgi:hypothetical protein